jgi:hypothetical protein
MKVADVNEWLVSSVTVAYFAYLDARIKALKEARGEGALVSDKPEQMFRVNWELVGGLKELKALRDMADDPEQVYEVFGVGDAV